MSDRDRLADLLITHRCYYHPGSGHYQCRGCEWEGYEPTEHIADALIIAGVTMPAPEQGRCTNCDGRRCMDCCSRVIHDKCVHDCPDCEPLDPAPALVMELERRVSAEEIIAVLGAHVYSDRGPFTDHPHRFSVCTRAAEDLTTRYRVLRIGGTDV